MNIHYIQKFWFGERYYTDTAWHAHYHTIQLPDVNIDAQIWLTILSPGLNMDEGVLGGAAAGIKSFRFIDKEGQTQFQEFDHWESHLRVERCTELTVAFHVRLAWAKAEGIIYWHD
jgi:hypothetical protein